MSAGISEKQSLSKSEKCRLAALRRYSDWEARFWSRVDKSAPAGCWIWTGGLDTHGYGQIKIAGTTWLVHRWSYTVARGPIQEGLSLDHLCRRPACVNPDHLEPVTHRTNVLRGVAPTAINARKTHCKRGHPLSGANLYEFPSGYRACRTCSAASRRKYAMKGNG